MAGIRPSVAVVACIALAMLPDRAVADAEVFALSWDRAVGAESCPDQSALHTEVARRLGRDPFEPKAPRRLIASVSGAPGAYQVRIEVRGAEGEDLGARQFNSDGQTCDGLFAAAVLAVALTIDPEASLAEPQPAESEGPVDTLELATDPSPQKAADDDGATDGGAEVEDRHTDDPVEGSRARQLGGAVHVSLRGAGALEVLPSFSPGFSVAVDWHAPSRLGWALCMVYFDDVEARGTAGDYRFGVTYLGADGLYDLVREPSVFLPLRVGMRAGMTRAVVIDPVPTDPGDHSFVAAALGVQLLLAVADPLMLDVGVEALVPLIRRRFSNTAGPVAFEQPRVGMAFHLGLGASL